MDPPPLPIAPTATAISATSMHLNYPESVESSPRSRHENPIDDQPLPAVPGARLRLMCSFGGHIMPRPHDKSLCYVGGETRLVAVDRHCSLSAFCNRLSRALLNGRPFSLKYQLPNEDLDSLVSVATDEDLENMIDEYDRLTASSTSSLSSSRIRLFLFFNRPDTAASMGPLLNDIKSETWFVDALNGSGLIPRGDSDSAAAMEALMNLDGETEGQEGAEEKNKQVEGNNLVHHHHQEVQYSLPDSPMVEKSSSFGSSSSSPSMSNLPPIRVRIDQDGGAKLQEQRIGTIEDQFAQMSFAPANNNIHNHKQDDGYGGAALPPHPATAAAMISPAGGSSDNLNRILSDDERSDQGVPVGFRKPPLPLQPLPLPLQQRPSGGYNNLPSPDSVASDSSIASANSISKNIYYQDQSHVVSRDNKAAINPTTSADPSIPSSQSQIQMQQVQDSYALAPQLDQQQHQQYIHYIPHPTVPHAPVAMSSYYPVYAAPSQQQKLHHPADHQQYPAVYMMPVTQVTKPQPYMSMQSNAGVMTMKSNVTDASIVAPTRPLTPPNPSIVAASAAYKEAAPPIYPTNMATLAKPEVAATVYRTAVSSNAQVVQVQQPYVGYSQMQHPPQQVAVNPAANYGYEYPNPTQDQMFYAQHQAPPLPPQYQTMTQAAAAAALADASKQQLPSDSNNQQIRISQPL
ncbi:Phox/Bem1p [Corchorus capsularis]|uniref:Phox/Bem1p n=1 Tax=Corchorus capsularis TaxID=210143 RepID=A0A1R3GH31_COCAP|nr:Phox/Bem1p [Corchorus capsularis]